MSFRSEMIEPCARKRSSSARCVTAVAPEPVHLERPADAAVHHLDKHVGQQCGEKRRPDKPHDSQPVVSGHPASGINRGGRCRKSLDVGQRNESPTREAWGMTRVGLLSVCRETSPSPALPLNAFNPVFSCPDSHSSGLVPVSSGLCP